MSPTTLTKSQALHIIKVKRFELSNDEHPPLSDPQHIEQRQLLL